jgi:hypothetical protein
MQLAEGGHLAYIVMHEAWYASSPGIVDHPEISVSASFTGNGGGSAWSFGIEEVELGLRIGPAIRVKVFDDAFPAFVQIPEFFAALASGQVTMLRDVRSVLDRMGAVDETERRGPDGSAPTVATARRIGKAIESMSVTRPGPDGLVTVNAENAAEAVMRLLGAESDPN